MRISNVTAPEHRIIFENQTTQVMVACEIGSRPWVEVGRRRAPGGRVERYDRRFLLMERVPHELTSESPGEGEQ